MRGADVPQEGLFVVRTTADYVPTGHPLVAIREILNPALRELDGLFESIYEERGRYSAPPEWLLRGLVLQALYGIRSERLLCEQLGYNMRYRWFVGLGMEDAAWDHSTYTQNRDRLIEHEVIKALFGQVMNQADAIPAYMGHVLMDNRSKLAVDTRLTIASGTAEREAAIDMLTSVPGEQRKSVGADKNYDTVEFVAACRRINVTPHVARNTYEYTTKTGKRVKRESALDLRTVRHAGYAVSQTIRKVIETLFGDGKQHGATIRQVKLRGRAKVNDVFTIAMLVVNLRRLPKLLAMDAGMAGVG